MKQPHKCPLCEMSPARWEKLRQFREVQTVVEGEQRNFQTAIFRCLNPNCGFIVTVYRDQKEGEKKDG